MPVNFRECEAHKINIIEVLRMVASGYREPEIAARIGVKSEAVRYRLKLSKKSKGARSLAQLVAIAIREGVIQ